MSTPAVPQTQAARRPSRPKKVVSAGPQQGPLEESQNSITNTTTPTKTKKKRQNPKSQQQQNQQQLEDPTQTRNPVSPLTPPRASNQKDSNNADVHVSPMASAAQPNGNGRGKKKAGSHAATPPRPRKSHSPQPPQTKEAIAATPAKATQIYAGPTFHASPAASSLPIPKFFSKSMPQVNNKEASLEAMMHDDVSEESTSQGDDSPTLRNSVVVEDDKSRTESPLDILFRADRAEKARQHLASPLNNISTPNDRFRASSADPARMSPRHHSRKHTDNAIFPLEMDGDPHKPEAQVSGSNTPLASTENKHVAPSPGRKDVAMTEALKQLLFSNPQMSQSPGQQSPSPSPTPPRSERYYGGSPNTRSQSSSPYSSIYGNNLSESRPAPSRLHSSQLRQEVSMDSVSELPSTPTPSRSKDIFGTNGSYVSSWSQNSRQESPKPRFEAQDALRATYGSNQPTTNPNAANEDILRKILKLDLLPSTGVR